MEYDLIVHGGGVAYYMTLRDGRFFLLYSVCGSRFKATGKIDGYDSADECRKAAYNYCTP